MEAGYCQLLNQSAGHDLSPLPGLGACGVVVESGWEKAQLFGFLGTQAMSEWVGWCGVRTQRESDSTHSETAETISFGATASMSTQKWILPEEPASSTLI